MGNLNIRKSLKHYIIDCRI